MEWLIEKWYYAFTVLIAIGGIMVKVLSWLHKKIIVDRFVRIENKVESREKLYKKV